MPGSGLLPARLRRSLPHRQRESPRMTPAPTHPLDPLTPDEIRRAAALVRGAHDLGPGMMFETISLDEPSKDIVAGFRPGQPVPRRAFVCAFDRTDGRVFEARLDL